jgi:phage terminase large subunit-like protein
MWDTSCLDWEQRILAGRSLVPDLPLFAQERDRALRVFNRLRLYDVIGKPRAEEAAADWYRDIVAALFGSFDVATNRRMIQELFLLIPKKNGKTTYAATTMLTAVIVNERPAAEFILVAPTINIAARAYRAAKGAIKADEALDKIFHCQDHIQTITHRRNDATLSIKAADTDTITGSLATGTLIDETHVFSKKSRAAEIFLEIRGALAARDDGFLIQITTQSKEPPSGVFKSELELARNIRDGKIQLDPARLAILYELPKALTDKGGWKAQRLWPLVNPNLGRSVNLNFLQNELATAQADSNRDEKLALLASQHFNVEIGLAMHADRWIGADYWEAAELPEPLTLEELIDRCEVCVVGIDGGGLDDLFGLTVIGRETGTGTWLWWSHAWAQDDVLRLRPENTQQLQDLAAAGELTFCTDPMQDVEEVVAVVVKIRDAGKLPAVGGVGLDPVEISATVDALADADIVSDEGQVVAIPQGYKLSAAVWGASRKLKDGTLKVARQALMRWCVGNAKVEPRGNAVLVTKQAAGKAKIDPLCAGFNAFELMSRRPQAARSSVYETRGVRVIG